MQLIFYPNGHDLVPSNVITKIRFLTINLTLKFNFPKKTPMVNHDRIRTKLSFKGNSIHSVDTYSPERKTSGTVIPMLAVIAGGLLYGRYSPAAVTIYIVAVVNCPVRADARWWGGDAQSSAQSPL